MLIFRGMRVDGDGLPALGNNKGCLHVDRGEVKEVNGQVIPSTGGMSAVDDYTHLPVHRKPLALGGTASDHIVFSIDTSRLGEKLLARFDSPILNPHHVAVEPLKLMAFDEYYEAVRSTRTNWKAI